MKKSYLFLVVFASLCALGSAHADENKADLEEIVIKAHPLIDNETAFSYSVLEGKELTEKLKSSIGETVESIPGIHSAGFGPAVGRPIVHGLGAARVKVTEDRIDTLDVSVISADHAVTVEPFIANKVTVLKGATNLLYGSGAIGGVVDVETGRIPTQLTGEPISGRIELRAADNGDAETGAFRLDGELGGGFAWHLDAFSKEQDDFDIPGFVESSQLRAQEEAEAAAAIAAGGTPEEEGEEERGELEGSFFDIQGGSVGFSYIGDNGFIGLSVSRTEGDYGLVSGHEEEDEGGAGGAAEPEEEAPGFIDLEQTRVDLEAELRFADGNAIEKVNFRFGINDYEHIEFEAPGEAGTVFDNEAWEARVELSHAELAGFSGVFGLQLNDREFSAVGEEAFVSPTDSDSYALFWAAERDFNALNIEAGVRFEETDYDSSVVAGGTDFDFSSFSVSLGGHYHLDQAWSVSALLDISSRAPTIEELFSAGPHLATDSFDIGLTAVEVADGEFIIDPNASVDEESVVGLSLGAQYEYQGVTFSATLYHLEFDDFIYQEVGAERNEEGELEEGELTELIYQQDDATFTGLDLQAAFTLAKFSQGDLGLSLLFDIVDAELDISGNDNLPRIPSERFGVGLNWTSEAWTANLNWTHVGSQTDVAVNELETSSYNDVDFRITRNFKIGEDNLSVFFSGENLTDDEQRNHVSFVKDIAPSIGRRFEVGVQYSF